jgi:arabinose-5-phosphate isomerase
MPNFVENKGMDIYLKKQIKMKNKSINFANFVQVAHDVMIKEARQVENMASLLDENFQKAVEYILKSKGRVVITGIGKSALVAQKIVATLNSTGTPSVFMHTADAMHGDLGMICPDDVIIMISKSGNTPEIKSLVPILRAMPNPVIAMTGNKDSYMARGADCVLNVYVDREVCPNNLAPTSSTTTQMVMGDALAVALELARDFGTEDFARYHPGGALGKRLYMRVSDVIAQNERPQVVADAPLKAVISQISSKRLGVTAVVDENGDVCGVITDGDIRRTLEKIGEEDIFALKASDIMTRSPKTIEASVLAFDAVEILQKYDINNLLVTGEDGKYVGVIHIHDLIKEGIV